MDKNNNFFFLKKEILGKQLQFRNTYHLTG